MSHDAQPDQPCADLRYPYGSTAAPTTSHIDAGALTTHRFADGGAYPPSYRAFVEQYGWARTFGLWLIYPPVRDGFADGRRRAERLTDRFRAVYRDGQAEGFDWLVEPDGTWKVAETLEVFGWSENGDALLWDVSARSHAGELPVWLSTGLDSLTLLGGDLVEALAVLAASASTGPSATDAARAIEPVAAARL
ncbi:hypothetical protein [Leucobacter aridicollis]|uniref:Uncharacterized protein n=1 Tax=Leucobacter aridicollis TaxID=283878 RepID=A0A852R1L9_9MICO|nr:hypothetical protein [Leucobacter aridicollis]NYD27491.1 hypothetical protein [Leucobacter aridicollis]